ncbi:hypothetical protein MTO96_001121 [Rhipicephalus appendiculatus]
MNWCAACPPTVVDSWGPPKFAEAAYRRRTIPRSLFSFPSKRLRSPLFKQEKGEKRQRAGAPLSLRRLLSRVYARPPRGGRRGTPGARSRWAFGQNARGRDGSRDPELAQFALCPAEKASPRDGRVWRRRQHVSVLAPLGRTPDFERRRVRFPTLACCTPPASCGYRPACQFSPLRRRVLSIRIVWSRVRLAPLHWPRC